MENRISNEQVVVSIPEGDMTLGQVYDPHAVLNRLVLNHELLRFDPRFSTLGNEIDQESEEKNPYSGSCEQV
jgi:hypothetical protein